MALREAARYLREGGCAGLAGQFGWSLAKSQPNRTAAASTVVDSVPNVDVNESLGRDAGQGQHLSQEDIRC